MVFVVPVLVTAQSPAKVPRIGVMMAGTPGDKFFGALRQGLQELGWVEGHNIAFEYRYADNRFRRSGFTSAEDHAGRAEPSHFSRRKTGPGRITDRDPAFR